MYREYNEKADFFVVYVSEAHPGSERRSDCTTKEPRSIEARAVLARRMVKELKLTMPVLIADLEKTVEKAYTPGQARTVIVGKDGKFLFAGKPGPGGAGDRMIAKTLKKLFP